MNDQRPFKGIKIQENLQIRAYSAVINSSIMCLRGLDNNHPRNKYY